MAENAKKISNRISKDTKVFEAIVKLHEQGIEMVTPLLGLENLGIQAFRINIYVIEKT